MEIQQKNKNTFLIENWFKLIISFALLIFIFVSTSYFFFQPYLKEKKLNNCLSDSSNNFLQQQISINFQIDTLEKQKEEASNKLTDFLKNNPQPPILKQSNFSHLFDDPYAKWVQAKDSFYDSVRNIEKQISDLEHKRDNVVPGNKKVVDDECYKRYK